MESLGWGSEAEAFSGRVVVRGENDVEAFARQSLDLGFSWELASQPADGVFDAALSPRGVRVAEVGLCLELPGDALVAIEFGATLPRFEA
jgi:hypothetical protein